MTDDRLFVEGSIEYLDVTVTSDAELTANAEISVDHGTTWLTAAWLGDPGNTRTCRALLDTADMSNSREPVWVRITDTPEMPIILAGFIKVI